MRKKSSKIFATVAAFSGALHALDPTAYAAPTFMLFSGGLMLGAVFMATDMVGSPMTAGGGMEFYIRNDVALRGEIRSATVLGQQLGVDGTIAYQYREYTIGFAFYRSLGG